VLVSDGRDASSMPGHICGQQMLMEKGISPSAVGFLLSASFLQRSTLVFIYTLLFPEGQTGGATS
jgi:hypothetical protein